MWKHRLIFPDRRIRMQGIEDSIRRSGILGTASKIKISAGELCSKYYHDPRIVQNLENAAIKGADIKIAYGPAMYVDDAEIIALAIKYPNLKLFKLNKRREKHYKLIDEKYLFSDKPHKIKEEKRKGVLLSPMYVTKGIGDAYEKAFDSMIEKAVQLDPKRVIETFRELTPQNEMAITDDNFIGFVKKPDAGDLRSAKKEEIDRLESDVKELLKKKRVSE